MANDNNTQPNFLYVHRSPWIKVQALIDFKQRMIVDIKQLFTENAGQTGYPWLKVFEIKKCSGSWKPS
jgi:hypothetical protein